LNLDSISGKAHSQRDDWDFLRFELFRDETIIFRPQSIDAIDFAFAASFLPLKRERNEYP
jgi:hypothetical protein